MSLWCNKTNPENQTGHFHDSSGLAFPVPSPARCSPIPLSSPLLAASPHADLSHRPKAAQTPPSAACGTSSSARGAGVAARGELAVDVGDSFSPGSSRGRLCPSSGLAAGGGGRGCHQRRCKAVPEAELPKALPALRMSREPGAVCSRQRDGACEQEKSETCPIPAAVNEPQHPQQGPAAGLPHLPGMQEASWRQQGDATCERAVSADVENGSCTRDGSVREPVSPQGTSAGNNEHKRNLRRLLGQWFRSHPVGAALLILLLLVLVLALGVALAVLAATQVPVTPATPQCCPFGWVGHNGVCYYFSRDYGSWEQGQERCSKLNASLAIAKDEEAMDLLFRLCGNGDFWLGLRRRGERLQWEDGSSYSSRVPVLGNSQCVYLADGKRFRSEFCSTERPYVCSKAQGPL
ncbi:uncharacterized protein LOC132329687 isoform X13 [Haemorhous mexicanus]|uniref:uncharacterized protein LOC132329687 isoform X13 n=1 Tax=Haemorhous mexicanus TaxID=30427 RepID=UPI0028BDC60E|nr:uncharacterized protein LOC132329687 isoform X13 [Haemorhous mexicanus]